MSAPPPNARAGQRRLRPWIVPALGVLIALLAHVAVLYGLLARVSLPVALAAGVVMLVLLIHWVRFRGRAR